MKSAAVTTLIAMMCIYGAALVGVYQTVFMLSASALKLVLRGAQSAVVDAVSLHQMLQM